MDEWGTVTSPTHPHAPTLRCKLRVRSIVESHDGGTPSGDFDPFTLKKCKDIVSSIQSHSLAGPFIRPVDIQDKILSGDERYRDYNTLVPHPMNLQTVSMRLDGDFTSHNVTLLPDPSSQPTFDITDIIDHSHTTPVTPFNDPINDDANHDDHVISQYHSFDDWVHDMRQVFITQREFEPNPIDKVHSASITLQNLFEKSLESLTFHRSRRCNRRSVMVERREFVSIGIDGIRSNVFTVECGRIRWYESKYCESIYTPWNYFKLTR